MNISQLHEKIVSSTAGNGIWGVVIKNVATKEGVSLNEDVSFNAASIIKLPIMAAAFADVYDQKLQLDERIVIRQSDYAMGSGIIHYLSPGLALTIYDLIVLMIVSSDNTATNILIDLVGMKRINEIMQQLGMNNSKIEHKLGLFYTGQEVRNVITAGDVAAMLSRVAEGTFLHRYACQQMISIMQKQIYRDGIPRYFPAPNKQFAGELPIWEFANKTGWISGIQHDVGILHTAHLGIYTITVLSNYVSTQSKALKQIAEIGRHAYEYIASKENAGEGRLST